MKKDDRGLSTVCFMIEKYYENNKAEPGVKEDLLAYVEKKLSLCPHGDNKPSCSSCNIHCYDEDHREKIKKVMRYMGPRMAFYRPLKSLDHFLEKFKGDDSGKN